MNAGDNFQFRRALTTYNAAFDYNNDGVIDSTDTDAFNARVDTSFTGLISFNPAALEPTEVSAVANTATSVTISWTAPADAVVSGYRIQYWSVAEGAWETLVQGLSATSTSYTTTAAVPDTAYEYEVATEADSRVSDWSSASNDVVTPADSATAQISGPAEVTEGDAYVLTLTAGCIDSTYTVQNWVISYGDGTTHTLSGDSASDQYTYNTPSARLTISPPRSRALTRTVQLSPPVRPCPCRWTRQRPRSICRPSMPPPWARSSMSTRSFRMAASHAPVVFNLLGRWHDDSDSTTPDRSPAVTPMTSRHTYSPRHLQPDWHRHY